MRYRRLGRSALRVSSVSLGSWLTFGHAVDLERTRAITRAAFDRGINFFDTADVYAMGACEEVLGRALEGLPRKDYVLATKVFFPTGHGPNDKGLSRKHVRESVVASLRRLRTDYLDLYQCHRHDPETPIEELVRTMDDLVRRGSILHWGVSLWPADRIAEAVQVARDMGADPPLSNQPVYNMLQREIERDVIRVSEACGVGQIVFSPLAQGLLTGKYREGTIPEDSRAADPRSNQFIQRHMTADNFARIERVRRLAADFGMSMAELALAWCLRTPAVNSVIIGATREDQVMENARAAEIDLGSGQIQALERALV